MSEFCTTKMNARKVLKDRNITITLVVDRRFRSRVFLGSLLVRLGAWVMPLATEVEVYAIQPAIQTNQGVVPRT